MVSITKLYLILRKKLLFVSVLPIEKARSYRITLGITEVILTGFTSSMHYFSPGNKLHFLPYSCRFFYLAFDNKLKANKAMNSGSQQAAQSKIQRYALHSQYKYKQMSWRKNDEEERMPDNRLGKVFQLPSRRTSRRWTRTGTNLVIFLEALCAQTDLF